MQLNVKLNTPMQSDDSGKAAALKSAAERKKDATESIEDAWKRILAQKNSDSDLRKLREVKRAMDEGIIGREAPKTDKNGKVKALGRFSKAEALRLHAQVSEMQREQKLAELVANTPDNYVLVTDEKALKGLVAKALTEPIIAVDTETTGLDVYVDVIVGVSLTLPTEAENGRHYYIPFEPTQDERALPIDMLEILRPLIESESVKKVFHNALYDMAMFKRHGMTLRGLGWDTQTAMHILNENEAEVREGQPKGNYKLKYLAPKYLKVPGDTFDELFGKNTKFAEVPLDIALVYAAKDTELTWKLFEFQAKHMAQMPEMFSYYTKVEVPLLYVILAMEQHGYILDMDFAKKYGKELHEKANRLYSELMAELTPHHIGDGPLNINSNTQLKPALSKAIGVDLPNLDAKKTLKKIKSDHPLVAKLLEYRAVTKLSGTYIETLPTKQHPVTKRWHSRFNPMGTVTGRFSSGKDEEDTGDTGFNVQNQPYEARKMFVAPPGKVLVSADFKAQEIRCVAHLSGEPALIEAFEKGVDPYANMASKYTGRPYNEVNKNPDGSDTKERKQMKVGWLSMLYGTSKYTLAEQLGTTPDEAAKFMSELFDSMPDLRDWIKENEKFAEKYGFVWMDGKQRKRRLPDAKLKLKGWGDKNFAKKNRAMRQATNARVQGSSSIQTKVTMLRAHEECLKREGWALWATVHDELIFEIPDTFTREDIEVIRSIMVDSYKWGEVANGTDIEIMRVWGEGMTPDDWFKQNEEEFNV